MQNLWQDLRFGARVLAKNPGFTLVAILILALGIGANTAIFTLVDVLYFKFLPVRDPDQIVHVFRNPVGGSQLLPFSLPDYSHFQKYSQTVTDIAGHYSSAPLHLVVNGEPRAITGSVVTASFFPLLGIRPHLGRFFTPQEDEVPDRDPVVVIQYGLWQRQFGADPQILEKSISLNGTSFRIVGVAPKGFQGVGYGWAAAEVWIPSAMFRVGYRYCDAFQPDCSIVDIIARRKANQSQAQVHAELDVLARQLAPTHANRGAIGGISVRPARGVLTDIRAGDLPGVTVQFVVAAVVLLIACANLAGLLLARGMKRQKEIAVRLAMGAGRARLVRQLLTESLLLSLAGGTAALLVAVWGNDLLNSFYGLDAAGRRLNFGLELNGVVIAATMGLSILTGIIFGIIPALQASRADLVEALKSGDARSGVLRSRLRDTLVVAQVALSIVLVVGAGLLLRSLLNVYRGQGIDAGHVALLRLRPSLVSYSPEKAWAFQREAIRRLESLPGVASASPSIFLSIFAWGEMTPLWLPGQTPDAIENAFRVPLNRVGPKFFRTIGVDLLEGREFSEQDRAGAPPAAIVNEALAKRFWPGQTATGRSLIVRGAEVQIVGVVRNAQYLTSRDSPVPLIYLNYWQQQNGDSFGLDSRTHVRITGDPHAMMPVLRREIAALDPNIPISEDYPLSERLAYTFRPVRLTGNLLLYLGGLAVFLSAIGLYGALAFSVSHRTREIAIRLALGAEPGEVSRMIVRRGAILGIIGAGTGLVGAFATARFLASMLYGVSKYDAATFLIAPLVLVGVALLASYIPARRAMRVEPNTALRYE